MEWYWSQVTPEADFAEKQERRTLQRCRRIFAEHEWSSLRERFKGCKLQNFKWKVLLTKKGRPRVSSKAGQVLPSQWPGNWKGMNFNKFRLRFVDLSSVEGQWFRSDHFLIEEGQFGELRNLGSFQNAIVLTDQFGQFCHYVVAKITELKTETLISQLIFFQNATCCVFAEYGPHCSGKMFSS